MAYYRYSGGSRQTEQSIEGQRRDCEAYARAHGMTILRETLYSLSVDRSSAYVPLFSATLRRVGVGTRVRAAVLLLYGFCPAVYGWDNVVLTESLSLSATVVFFFLIVRYIQERRFWDGAGALLVTLWLIFLRPQFLTYPFRLMAFPYRTYTGVTMKGV